MSTITVGIDPGNKQSGWVCVQFGRIVGSGVCDNGELLKHTFFNSPKPNVIAIEWIQAMGMSVGKEVFETCMWVGRFAQAARCHVRLIPRGRIKLHHCGSARAKDGNIAQALRDKYGEKGTKKEPGYFYGVSSHAWQAFAVAAYVMEGAEHESEIRINA
jgi:hypothetical protein